MKRMLLTFAFFPISVNVLAIECTLEANNGPRTFFEWVSPLRVSGPTEFEQETSFQPTVTIKPGEEFVQLEFDFCNDFERVGDFEDSDDFRLWGFGYTALRDPVQQNTIIGNLIVEDGELIPEIVETHQEVIGKVTTLRGRFDMSGLPPGQYIIGATGGYEYLWLREPGADRIAELVEIERVIPIDVVPEPSGTHTIAAAMLLLLTMRTRKRRCG